MHIPAIHLCIVQPLGYVHSLCFLDHARFFRHQFRRMGADVSLGKNRLRHGAVNIIFGAHLGFDPSLRQRYTCLFLNLEQLGPGGASVSADYIQLLASSAVIDYHRDNVSAYQSQADDVPLVSFGHAPYLAKDLDPGADLASRPIDILFFGSMNERRRMLIEQIERSGRQVTLLDRAIYGPERDSLIIQAKAVLNLHYYESARFEQARVFQCLSLGTPVISERSPQSGVPTQFEDCVHWIDPNELSGYFSANFDTPSFHAKSQTQLQEFRKHDVIEEYAEVLAFAAGYFSEHQRQLANQAHPVWQPIQLQIGSGKDYRLGWFNVDIQPSTLPDAVLDLSAPMDLPLSIASEQAGPVVLSADSLEIIYANNVLEHVADLPRMMGNCLQLLREDGQMLIEVPYEKAPTAWQDPTHVRAFNENSWLYYTDWFWYLGWFEYRFAIQSSTYLDGQLQPCSQDRAHFMRIHLIKQPTSMAERMTARTMQADFGGIASDDL